MQSIPPVHAAYGGCLREVGGCGGREERGLVHLAQDVLDMGENGFHKAQHDLQR